MNAQSVVNKINELKAQVLDIKPDLIAIVETWTHKDIDSAYLNIDSYTIVDRFDRTDTTKGRGGGVLLYSRIPNVSSKVTKFNEQFLHVNISTSKHVPDIQLHIVYRSPNSNETNNTNLVKYITDLPENSIVVGDFNYPGINWSNLSSTGPDATMFLETCNEKFLNQLVDFPTHFTPQKDGSVTATCIDLVLTDRTELVASVHPSGQLGASKHSMLVVEFIVPSHRNKTLEMIPDYSKTDFVAVKQILANINWHNELVNLNTEESWKIFKDKLLSVVESATPMKKRRVNNRPLWMQQSVMRIIRKKKRQWELWCTTQDYRCYLAHKKTEREVSKAVRKAKRNLEKKLAKDAKNNPKPFYRYMNNQSKIHTKVGPLKDENGVIQTADSDLVKLLNTQFSSVFTAEDHSNLPIPEQVFSGSSPLTDHDITPVLVSQKIERLNPNKASGPDKIYPKVVKELSEIIASPLSIIFNKSLQEGIVPSDWKMANVTSIFKKGDRTCAANYRPISLTSIICRLMESILRDAILDHLRSYKLIRPSQHGFMPKRSCLTNLLEFLEEITRIIDEGHCVDLIYLDFAKAFDKVPHMRLLSKIKAHGISGNIGKWIQEWLHERKQRVVLNGTESCSAEVTSGVPQGSVLGPILFVIYINDIDTAIDTLLVVLKKFADDTKAAAIVDTVEQSKLFQVQLNEVFKWSVEWQMLFNLDKCKVMHIGLNNKQHKYYMDGHQLKVTESEKDIGVYIHNSLKPSVQVAEAAKKANQVLGQLLRSVSYRDKFHFVRLYKQRVRCHLELAVQAWSPWLQQDIKLLEDVQKRAVRNVCGLTGSYEEKLNQIGLTPLVDRRIRGDMLQTFKIMNNIDDVDSNVWFMPVHQVCSYPTRHTGRINEDGSLEHNLNIVQPIARLDIRKEFFSNRVPKTWNTLPSHIQKSSSVNHFKRQYDNWYNANQSANVIYD